MGLPAAPSNAERAVVSDDRDPTASQQWLVGSIVVVGVAGLVLRMVLLASAEGRFGGDDAYAGLQAMAILDGDLPIVIRGAVYTAVLESYVYAPIVAVTGGSLVLLRLFFVAIWGVAAVLAGRAAGELAAPVAGVVAGAVVWIAPGALLTVSIRAYPGYALGMVATLVVLLLARRLIDLEVPTARLAFWMGFAAGLGFWIHSMYVAVLTPVVASAFVVQRRYPQEMWLPAIGGAILGCSPFLAWNAVNGLPSITDQPSTEGDYADRLRGVVLDLLPRAFGLKDAALEWRLGSVLGSVLYGVLILAVVGGCAALWRASAKPSRLLVPIALAAVVPLMALLPALIFTQDGRYGVIVLPLVAVAIGALATSMAGAVPPRRRLFTAGGVLAAWLALFVTPAVVDVVRTIDEDPNRTYFALEERLDEAGVETVYGSFWQVLPLDFVADGDLTVGVLPYYSIRFPDEQRAAEAAAPEDTAFVFSSFDEDPLWLRMPVDRYVREQIGEAVLYLPLPEDR